MRAIVLPHLVLRNFLAPDEVAGLLAFALAHEAAFQPMKTRNAVINTAVRTSAGTRELGPYRALVEAKVTALIPEFVAKLHVALVADCKLELELVAHNDGAFYKRHIDTLTASERDAIRILSAVYYFHREPKAFSGGALRLHAISDAEQKTFVDIEPMHNALLVFPSWAPHEVMPINCPSKQFADSRFAINCWINHKKPAQ